MTRIRSDESLDKYMSELITQEVPDEPLFPCDFTLSIGSYYTGEEAQHEDDIFSLELPTTLDFQMEHKEGIKHVCNEVWNDLKGNAWMT